MKRKERSCKQIACRTALLLFLSKFWGATACTGKASLLMRMQGKTPKGLRARQQCARSASRTARPVADQPWPPFSRLAGKTRHPLWLSRRFDDAAAQKGLLPDVVFLRNPGHKTCRFFMPETPPAPPDKRRRPGRTSGRTRGPAPGIPGGRTCIPPPAGSLRPWARCTQSPAPDA